MKVNGARSLPTRILRVHANRIVGFQCHHCHSGGDALALVDQGKFEGPGDPMHEQSSPSHVGVANVHRGQS